MENIRIITPVEDVPEKDHEMHAGSEDGDQGETVWSTDEAELVARPELQG